VNPQPNRSLIEQVYDGFEIPNWIDPDPAASYVTLARTGPGYINPFRILGPSTGRYNCHGLVFASRRTNIPPVDIPVNIEQLLVRDQYGPVDGPALGDIAVYRTTNGEIDHTGIVSRVEFVGTTRVVFIWSKWGALEECEHRETSCPYSDCSIEYWRLRNG
jgi:hypothetical protein